MPTARPEAVLHFGYDAGNRLTFKPMPTQAGLPNQSKVRLSALRFSACDKLCHSVLVHMIRETFENQEFTTNDAEKRRLAR
jgi:hypothetical protein